MFGLSSKRQREHEDLADIDTGVSHERKKFRPLSLRTSPNAFSRKPSFTEANLIAPRFGVSTLTPVESSDDDDDGDNKNMHNHLGGTGRLPQLAPQPHALRNTMDVDHREALPSMNVDNMCAWSANVDYDRNVPHSPIPNSLVNHSLNISEQNNTSSVYSHPPAIVTPAATRDQDPTPPAYGQSQDTAWWQSQRLPSPISECEDALASSKDSVSVDDADMTYNTSRPASFSPRDGLGMWGGTPDMQRPISPIDMAEQDMTPAPALSTMPGKKKVTFSMGFRADCDKCRRKVPGHYSHIIRA